MLSQFTGQQETDGGLDLAAGDGRPLVVVGQAGRLGSDALEDVVDEAVHDAHGFGRDAGVGVDLLQDFVDVDGIAFLPLALLLLVSLGDVLGGLAGLFGCFTADFRGHGARIEGETKLRAPSERAAFYMAAGGMGETSVAFTSPNLNFSVACVYNIIYKFKKIKL